MIYIFFKYNSFSFLVLSESMWIKATAPGAGGLGSRFRNVPDALWSRVGIICRGRRPV